MKPLSECTKVDHNGKILFIDQKIKLSEIKKAYPLFFKNNNNNEKIVVHRGFVAVLDTSLTMYRVNVHAFDVKRKRLVYIGYNLQASNVDQKAFIKSTVQAKLSAQQTVKMETVQVEMLVPVTVSMNVFRKDNKITGMELDHVVSVDQDSDMKDGIQSHLERMAGDKIAETENKRLANQVQS